MPGLEPSEVVPACRDRSRWFGEMFGLNSKEQKIDLRSRLRGTMGEGNWREGERGNLFDLPVVFKIEI